MLNKLSITIVPVWLQKAMDIYRKSNPQASYLSKSDVSNIASSRDIIKYIALNKSASKLIPKCIVDSTLPSPIYNWDQDGISYAGYDVNNDIMTDTNNVGYNVIMVDSDNLLILIKDDSRPRPEVLDDLYDDILRFYHGDGNRLHLIAPLPMFVGHLRNHLRYNEYMQ